MSATPSPQRKRLREELDCDPLVGKDREVWLEDGNIVLIAQNTAFRVYKHILMECSEVFRTRLSSIDETTQQLAGCPAIAVEGDSEDLHHLFLVLFRRKNYYHNGDDIQPVHVGVLASLIRAAHRYAIRDVLDQALNRLKKYYTTDLHSWADCAARSRYVIAGSADAITVVQIARLTDTPSLLPTAFLLCRPMASHITPMPNSAPIHPLSVLSAVDQASIAHGSNALYQDYMWRVATVRSVVPAEECTNPAACSAAAQAVVHSHAATDKEAKLGEFVSLALSVAPVHEWFWRAVPGSQICDRCRTVSATADEALRTQTWNALPRYFWLDIKGWGVELS